MLKLIRKLEEQIRQEEQALIVKARTDTLDDLRHKAGVIYGLRAALQLVQQESTKEFSNG